MKHNDNFKIIYPDCYYGIRQSAKILGMNQKAVQYKIKYNKIPYIIYNERILIAERVLLSTQNKKIMVFVITPKDYEKNIQKGNESFIVETFSEQTLGTIMKDMKDGCFEVVEKKWFSTNKEKGGLRRELVEKNGYVLEGTVTDQDKIYYKCKRLDGMFSQWCLGNYCIGGALATQDEWKQAKANFLAKPSHFYMIPHKWLGKNMYTDKI